MSSAGIRQASGISWRLGICAALAMTLLSLIPQFHLWLVRGRDWQGTSVSFDFDEVAYASYLNALIDGRPRRNDPYSGRDDRSDRQLHESLHSIQFVAAYAAAIPARLFGLSTGTTFIVIRVVSAFATTLAIFWLLSLLIGDPRFAAAGAIIVLCLGGIAGEAHDFWRISTFRGVGESLPFLRRYVPALVFPLLFCLLGLVWQGLHSAQRRARIIKALLAGLTFAILIFSYFFLWTTALAWLFSIGLLLVLTQRKNLGRAFAVLAIVVGCGALALIPYVLLLFQRSPTIDSAQLLTHSRLPVLSPPVFIGAVAFVLLLVAVWKRWLMWRAPAVVFTGSFALLPAIVFNQQIVTGLLLQPVHYSRYSANYVSVLAILLALVLIGQARNHRYVSPRLLAIIAAAVFSWAVFENGVRAYRLGAHNSDRDDARRVALRLRELGQLDKSGLVFSSDLLLGDTLPNDAPQPILWTPHLFVFSGASAAENRERLYQQLYYSGVEEQQLVSLAGSSSYFQLALFGWERMNQKSYAPPITEDDVRKEIEAYNVYISNFGMQQANTQRLTYVVVPAIGGPSLNNLDRWYVRDKGERVGNYVLYRVELRQ